MLGSTNVGGYDPLALSAIIRPNLNNANRQNACMTAKIQNQTSPMLNGDKCSLKIYLLGVANFTAHFLRECKFSGGK